MKPILYFAGLILFFSSCKKDKYTTAPQIKYISVSPQIVNSTVINSVIPRVTFSLTDAEGDIGFKTGIVASYIYFTNNLTGGFDSLIFPDLQNATRANLKADITAALPNNVLKCRSIPGGALHTDTLYFNMYVKDFAGNKSNVITTGDPVYFTCR